ncbi:MAG: hypothetical protein KC776_21005 [Myxococcales bacterium]|nr:hypothetical protein [Myxococcales bacterium]
MTEALLVFEAARIDADGAPLLEGLNASASGPRVTLIGEFGALFALLAGEAKVTAGSVRIAGHSAEGAVAEGVVGLLLADPPLPLKWKALEYLSESAALLGHPLSRGRALAAQAMARLGLDALADRRLEALTLLERRSVLLAHALLGDPPVLALQDPLSDLSDREQEAMTQLLDRAQHDKSLLVSSRAHAVTGHERALVDRADATLVLEAGTLTGHVGPARHLTDGRRYRVTATKNGDALADALTERGHHVDVAEDGSGVARLLVELVGDESVAVITRAALAAEAPVVELIPLGNAAQ